MANDKSLRSSELFAGVPPAVVQAVLGSATRVQVKRGSCFYRTEEPAHRLFILTFGRVKLRLLTPSGCRVLFRFIRPGDFFGYWLGLWVSRSILEKHGGSIRLHSGCDGQRPGTTVSIFLPLKISPAKGTDRESRHSKTAAE